MAMTFAYNDEAPHDANVVRSLTASWVCDASGDAAGTCKHICGELLKVITNPTDGPTADYDIVVTDDQSFNVLTNADDDLVDRHTTTTEEVNLLIDNAAGTAMALHPVVDSALTFTVAAAGITKAGTITLFYRGKRRA